MKTNDNTVVNAINKALKELDKSKSIQIDDLASDKTTDGTIICTSFAGAVYQYCGGSDSSEEIAGGSLTGHELDTCEPGNLINVLLDYGSWDFNHAFCIYFASDAAYVIQTYVKKETRIITGFDTDGLKTHWRSCALYNAGSKASFAALFGVEPGELPALQRVLISR